MGDVQTGESCNCESDCEELTFTKLETNKDLNLEELCQDTSSWVYKYMATTKRNREGYQFQASVKKVLEDTLKEQSAIDYDECIDMVKNDLAIVTMEIGVATIAETVREEATSFSKFQIVFR